ncbi:hypothetical protein TrST_g5572 [Triparma strigata]|uniref:2-oxoisovalerate dehydrogenase subunit alpha n=1 Tax=Triparma strigata TaxID=1606541 RepID=A0A9W7B8F6_9STRA|nr:hypothetical protein TrST_g5572 [Triparma strigata]
MIRSAPLALRLSSRRLSSSISSQCSAFNGKGRLQSELCSKALTSLRGPSNRHFSSSTLHDISTVDIDSDSRIYAGDVPLPLTTDCTIFEADDIPTGKYPVFRVMDENGVIRDDAKGPQYIDPELNEEHAVKMFRTMSRLNVMDNIFLNAQRQGRISFYMSSQGEEAVHIGSASALDNKDVIFAQYRETGVLMWRGFTMSQFADQCFSNSGDLGKGRQMPVHYGSRALNFHTISSPLTTQLPQAAGAAYAMKMEAIRNGSNRAAGVTVCYFGDGAASEGDFHAAMNIAATMDAPIIFFCRNNGFAISTPVADQYRGDGIASRAKGYGMASIRVDGNDLFAVNAATARAKELALSENRPVLIETMSYRVGHHSTSDDSTRYRSTEEIKKWDNEDNPIDRFRRFCEAKGWLDEERVQTIRDEEKINVLQALESAEKKGPPALATMFDDVYKEKTPELERQEAKLLEHVAKYPERYTGPGH